MIMNWFGSNYDRSVSWLRGGIMMISSCASTPFHQSKPKQIYDFLGTFLIQRTTLDPCPSCLPLYTLSSPLILESFSFWIKETSAKTFTSLNYSHDTSNLSLYPINDNLVNNNEQRQMLLFSGLPLHNCRKKSIVWN